MCGINGLTNFKNYFTIDERLKILEMNDLLKLRGPDGKGVLEGNLQGEKYISYSKKISNIKKVNFVLGHTRLAIIDLTDSALQPISNEDNTIFIVYNGEVYNYIELRVELIKRGHNIKSRSDSDVVLHSYEEWGVRCVEKFNGMWAFAVLDFNKKRLFCSRDRFGIKPFYYFYDGETFIFSSEIKSILINKKVEKKINNKLFFEYIASRVEDYSEETLYEGIYRLPPAHNLILNNEGIKKYRYWDIEGNINYQLDFATAKEKYRELLKSSVGLRLKGSDVEVASCLSGGIDSSSIVSIISDFFSDGTKLKTFSYAAEEEDVDETEWVEKIVASKNIINYKIKIDTKKLISFYEDYDNYFDEIHNPTSPFSQYMVMKEINGNNIKVTLDGQGADEMLAGYRWYLHTFYNNKTYEEIKKYEENYNVGYERGIYTCGYYNLFGAISQGTPLFEYINPGFWEWYEKNYFLDEIEVKNNRGEKIRKKSNDNFVLNIQGISFRVKNRFESILKNCLYNDVLYRSLPRLLRYEDTNSMHFSVESRVPFLDYRLVEFVFSLPEHFIISEGVTKYIARESVRGIVPDEILNRISKRGYTTPERKWVEIFIKDYVFEKYKLCRSSLKEYLQVDKIDILFEKLLRFNSTNFELDSKLLDLFSVVAFFKKCNML